MPVSVHDVKNGAAVIGGVLEGQRAGACLLTRGGEALQQPAEDQKRRREPADGGVRGQAADREGRHTHQHEREHQHVAPADAVAEVAEDEGADRPCDVGDTERRERQHLCRVVARREEHLREDQRRCGAEEEEVVVLDGAAHEAGERGPARGFAVANHRLCHRVWWSRCRS